MRPTPLNPFQDVLRVHAEPCIQMTEQEVHNALVREPASYLAFLRQALVAIADGSAQVELPPKQLFEDGPDVGDFRVMPCVFRRGDEVRKTVKLVGTNRAQQIVPDQITVGRALVMHPVENFVSHIIDACLLSSARTGACAALAAESLAGDARELVVVGAGRVGYYAALFVASLLPEVQRVTFCDRNAVRAQHAARVLAQGLPALKEVRAESEAWRRGEVLVLATTSETSFCHPEETSARLVVSLGADCDSQSELHSDWAGQAALYVDLLDSACYGDLKGWLALGLISRKDLTDLFTLLRRPAAQEGRSLFVSTGSALFDNLTIAYLLSRTE
jgi:ornithine cyclodeaminase/alanine dehydrogenase-like protein (mu-crystallin family)